ncbi:MAG: 5-oxoprolinase, partial [Candidatus Dadabacteria bacterium]
QAELAGQGFAAREIQVRRRVYVRYRGTDTALAVEADPLAGIPERFRREHRIRFGFALDRPIVVEAAEVEALGGEREPGQLQLAGGGSPTGWGSGRAYFGGRWTEVPVVGRQALGGRRLEGPAIVVDDTSTVVVEPGWMAESDGEGGLVLRRTTRRRARMPKDDRPDPVRLEIFNRRFMAVAEQMGETLRNTAQSVNIKERMDFSCAVFDEAGRLVANAPHIPVHLGSMTRSVEALIAKTGGRFEPGEAYAHNSPYHGGTHLPDITVVTPVFRPGETMPSFFVASRGHHADVGGVTPGSMPPGSRTVDEEGVWTDGLRILEGGRFCEGAVRNWLAGGAWPARNPDQNLGDLRAQLAANETGARELLRLCEEFGWPTVSAYMGHVRANAAACVRRLTARLRPGSFEVTTDRGVRIRVRVDVDPKRETIQVDFSGTSPQQSSNVNAPLAVTQAVVLYVLRTLLDDEIPLNAGCLDPVDLIVPSGSVLNPRPPAAVAAGNVETSQAVADALFGALGVLAGSQGTMNNFTFGDRDHQYYETIAGGAGAGPGFPGADAVQTHMTNTKITDPEVLEWRYPVRVERFAIRRGSGGGGRYRGGDGVVRRIRFLRRMSAAIVSDRRVRGAFGLAGGTPGACGRNAVERADGSVEELPGCAQVDMGPGDVFVIETPGGGGYGRPTEEHLDD